MKKRLASLIDLLTPNVTTNIWYAAILFWVPVVIFLSFASEVLENEQLPLDILLLNYLHDLSTAFWDAVILVITNFGGAVFIVPVTILLAALLYVKRNIRAAKAILFIVGGAGITNFILKLLFERARPALWDLLVYEPGFSFPSGHAMASSALAFSLIAICWNTKWRRWVIGLGGLYMVLIGLSRVYLGVHYPSDILAGWSVSLLWALVVYAVLYKRLSKQ